ncbi:MAG: T9SS type A sorting domain-containing protein [Chitinophagales bacterium]|nr:T9SS type A sorting domain-containing protein [Chitinophagales bacterium]
MKTLNWLLICFLFSPFFLKAQYLISDSLILDFTKAEVDSYMVAQGIPANPLVPVNYGVKAYKIVYNTVNSRGTGNTIASGLFIVPQNVPCPLPLGCYNHGTINYRFDVPSRISYETPIGIVFSSDGYATAMPDYLGLGDSPGMHPYVHAKSEATATRDMLRACREFCANNNIALNGQIFLTGYSQGGHAAMATQRELETFHANEFTVTACAPLSGPYDISGKQKDFLVANTPYPDPSYLPYVMFAYQDVYGTFYDSVQEVIVSPYDTLLPPLFDGTYNTGQINAVMPSVPKLILVPQVLADFQADTNHFFNVALKDNDTWRGWIPRAPILMTYCEGDKAVNYENAIVARDRLIAAGGQNVVARSGGANNDHGGCVTPALLNAKLFFDGYRKRENNLAVQLIGDGESVPGASDAGALASVSGGTGYTIQWSNGENDSLITGLQNGEYTVTVTDSNGCAKTATITLGTTGINDAANKWIRVYPNPAETYVLIDWQTDYKVESIVLMDLTGRKIYQLEPTLQPIQMDRKSLPAGVYIVEIKVGESIVREKVLFQ